MPNIAAEKLIVATDRMNLTGEVIEIAGHALRWARDSGVSGSFAIHYALMDASSCVIGSHIFKDEAIKQAKCYLYPKIKRMSLEQFRDVALSVHVVPGCKAQSVRRMGRQSEDLYLFDDVEELNSIRKEAKRAYSMKDADDRPIDYDKFQSDFIALLQGMAKSKAGIHLLAGTDFRPIILINMRSHAARISADNVVKFAYEKIYLDDFDEANESKDELCTHRKSAFHP